MILNRKGLGETDNSRILLKTLFSNEINMLLCCFVFHRSLQPQAPDARPKNKTPLVRAGFAL